MKPLAALILKNCAFLFVGDAKGRAGEYPTLFLLACFKAQTPHLLEMFLKLLLHLFLAVAMREHHSSLLQRQTLVLAKTTAKKVRSDESISPLPFGGTPPQPNKGKKPLGKDYCKRSFLSNKIVQVWTSMYCDGGGLGVGESLRGWCVCHGKRDKSRYNYVHDKITAEKKKSIYSGASDFLPSSCI